MKRPRNEPANQPGPNRGPKTQAPAQFSDEEGEGFKDGIVKWIIAARMPLTHIENPYMKEMGQVFGMELPGLIEVATTRLKKFYHEVKESTKERVSGLQYPCEGSHL